MRHILCTLALILAPTVAAAHEVHHGQSHSLLAPGAYDTTPPRAEYEGHFYHGHVHHGAAHHGGGHLNAEAAYPTKGTVYGNAETGGFVILIEPNLVNRTTARAAADPLAVAYCRETVGASTVAYTNIERYSPARLEAWSFAGSCR